MERQLRARARTLTLYWSRLAVALVGTLICLLTLNVSIGVPGAAQSMMGHYAFHSIVSAAFLLCLCAGFLTVDGISRERREGTLVVLCLTRVKALDVLLGSFGAAGITCLCALLSLAPVLMLPVLAGGVTGGEAFRVFLVLFDTLLLSLSAGLWASANARGWLQSARSAVGMLFCIVALPAFALLVPVPLGYLFGISPLAAFSWADDAAYRLAKAPYWISLAVILGVSCRLIIAAGFRLRRALREDDGRNENVVEPGRKPAAARSPIADAEDPMRWLLRRQRGVKVVVWSAVVIGIFPLAAQGLLLRGGLPSIYLAYIYGWSTGLAISVVQGSLFAWAASRFLVEARRCGELELLLTSPAGADTIVSSQWHHLRRLFLLPVVVGALPGLAWEIYYTVLGYSHSSITGSLSYQLYSQLSAGLICVNLIVGAGALIWVGLWFGFRARSQAGAVVQIVLLSKVVPDVLGIAGSFLLRAVLTVLGASLVISGNAFPWGYTLYLLNPAAQCLYYFWLMRWARRRLAAELANPSLESLDLADTLAAARAGAASFIAKARNWPRR
jgi:ABC-type transport system involved in multi-copper enzyme maturation permease subunit